MNADYKTDYHYGFIPWSAAIVVVCLVVIQTTVKYQLVLCDMTTKTTTSTIIQYMNDYNTDYHYGLIPDSACIVVVHLVGIQKTVQQTDTSVLQLFNKQLLSQLLYPNTL